MMRTAQAKTLVLIKVKQIVKSLEAFFETKFIFQKSFVHEDQ